MPGQPSWFNVSSLAVTEPAGKPVPPEIIEVGQNFDLTLTFDGDDTELLWMLYEFFGAGYEVNFYAEGLGVAAPDIDLGTVNGNLLAGGGPYTATLTSNIPTPGLYRVGSTVIFPGVPGEVAGFIENVLIHIHPPTLP